MASRHRKSRANQRNIFLTLEEERQKNEGRSLNFRRRRHRLQSEHLRQYSTLACQFGIVILIALLFILLFGRGITMAGASMENTMASGDYVLVNRLKYHVSDPEAGDIIAFRPTNNQNAQYTVKRIVAVPGDSIYINSTRLYVNGKRYKYNDIGYSPIREPGMLQEKTKLGKDEYFVIGDNYNNSEDSRYATIGRISKSDMLGCVWFDTTRGHFGLVH